MSGFLFARQKENRSHHGLLSKQNTCRDELNMFWQTRQYNWFRINYILTDWKLTHCIVLLCFLAFIYFRIYYIMVTFLVEPNNQSGISFPLYFDRVQTQFWITWSAMFFHYAIFKYIFICILIIGVCLDNFVGLK